MSALLQVRIAWRVIVGPGRRRNVLLLTFAIPLLLATLGMSVLGASTNNSAQRATSLMGSADALLGAQTATTTDMRVTQLAGAASGTASVVPVVETGEFPLEFDGLTTAAEYRETDWASPAATGWLDLTSGRAPRAVGEIAVTVEFAAQHHLVLGSTVHARWSARPATVVGLTRPRLAYTQSLLLAAPGQLNIWVDPNHLRDIPVSRNWLVDNCAGSCIATLQQSAQNEGLRLQTRASVAAGQSLIAREPGVVAAPGLLLVAVGAAAAFTVRVRRLRGELSLLSAVGFDARWILRACRLAAVLAAASGAAIGAVVGTGIGASARPALRTFLARDLSPASPRLADCGLLIVFATLIAWAAVWFPIRGGLRASAHSQLIAAPDVRRTSASRRFAVTAALFGLLAVSVAAIVNGKGTSATFALIGTAGMAAALLALLPQLLRTMSRAAGGMSISVRVALRNMARESKRPVAAISIGFIAMSTTVATLVILASVAADGRKTYVGSRHLDQVEVILRHVNLTPSIESAFKRGLASGATVVATKYVSNAPTAATPEANYSAPTWLIAPAASQTANVDAQPKSVQVIDTPTEFEALTGRPATAAEWSALQSGRLLVFNSWFADNGTGLLLIPSTDGGTMTQRSVVGAQISDPVDATTMVRAGAVLTSEAARRLGAFVSTRTMLASKASPTAATSTNLARNLEPLNLPSTDYRVERGPTAPTPTMSYVLLALSSFAVLATLFIALAASTQEMRPDLRRLSELGFPRRSQVHVVLWQSLTIATASSVLGILCGLTIAASRTLPYHAALAVNWTPIIVALTTVLGLSAIISPVLAPSSAKLRSEPA